MLRLMKLFLIIFAIVLATGFFLYNRGVNSENNKDGEDIKFKVAQGESVKKIGANLKARNLIKSTWAFETHVWFNDLEKKFQSGEYILKPGLSAKEVVRILTQGEALSKEASIKIIEGWNLLDIAKYLEKEGRFKEEEFLGLTGYPKIDYRVNKDLPKPVDYTKEFSFLKDKPTYYGLEGYIFPDTYRVYADASVDDIIIKALVNFDNKLTAEMRDDIKKQGRTIYEVVTMASVIEKEVRGEKDMKIVSGLFWDRIKNQQALESCATLAYILGVNKAQYTLADTKIDSPYNTYQNRGLPPGPIANPGLTAIKAAIYPEYTDYNYFLNRTDNGETVFSVTYEEHLRNKAKYLN